MNQGYPGEVEGSHPLDQSQQPAEQQQPASEQTQDQSAPDEQPSIEQPQSVVDLTPPKPSELGQDQPPTPEQPQVQPSSAEELKPEIAALLAEAKGLYESARRLLVLGHSEGPGGTLSAEDQSGSLTMWLVKKGADNTSEQWTVRVQNNHIQTDKHLQNQEGDRLLSVSMNATEGTVRGALTKYSPGTFNPEGPDVKLNDKHIQSVAEHVMSSLRDAVESRELHAADSLDKEVADILGMEIVQ